MKFVVFVNGKEVDTYQIEKNAAAHVEMAINLGNEAYYKKSIYNNRYMFWDWA